MEGESLVSEQYSRMAHVYEERVVPRFRPIAARTVALAALGEGERVLDVGCGTGLATLLASQAVGAKGEVVGVDFSEGQLGIAVAKALLTGAANARFERHDATKLAFSGAFDACVSNLGVPADFAPALAGMGRALRSGGRLSVTEWERSGSEPFESFRRLLGERLHPNPPPDVRAAREILARRRASFDLIGTPAAFRDALAAAGFRGVEVRSEAYDVRFASARDAYDFLLSWGWQEHEVRLMDGEEREGLMLDMAARFGAAPFTATWRLLHATGHKV